METHNEIIEMMMVQMSRYQGRLLERVLELIHEPEYWIHLEVSHCSYEFAPWA